MSRKPLTKKQREEVYNKYLGHCAYCGCTLEYKDMQVDHFAPYHLFGDNIQLSNLMPACRMCNFRKNSLTIEKFRNELAQVTSRLDRDSFNYRLAKKFNLITEIPVYKIEFYYEKVEDFLSRTKDEGMADWSDIDHEFWNQMYSEYGADFVKWYQQRIEVNYGKSDCKSSK